MTYGDWELELANILKKEYDVPYYDWYYQIEDGVNILDLFRFSYTPAAVAQIIADHLEVVK